MGIRFQVSDNRVFIEDESDLLILTRSQFLQVEPEAILPPNEVIEVWTQDQHYIQDPDQKDGSYLGSRSQYVSRLDQYRQTLFPVTQPTLEQLKLQKIEQLKNGCNQSIRSGFQSDALGVNHTYSSEVEDQLNLIGARLSNVALTFGCTDNTGKKNQKSHTAAQLKKVFDDGLTRKHQLMTRFYQLKAQVEAATTTQEVEGIVWSEG